MSVIIISCVSVFLLTHIGEIITQNLISIELWLHLYFDQSHCWSLSLKPLKLIWLEQCPLQPVMPEMTGWTVFPFHCLDSSQFLFSCELKFCAPRIDLPLPVIRGCTCYVSSDDVFCCNKACWKSTINTHKAFDQFISILRFQIQTIHFFNEYNKSRKWIVWKICKQKKKSYRL